MKINNIDKFGCCVICHRNLVINKVIGGKVQGTWHPDKDDAYMKLNQGSLMPISICKPCKNNIDLTNPDTHTQIMEAVNNGWELEINYMKEHPEQFKDFTIDKEKSLRDMYSSLNITGYEHNHKVGV